MAKMHFSDVYQKLVSPF